MISKLLNHEIIHQDWLKSEKKRITGTPSIGLYLLKLITNDYHSAEQVFKDLIKSKVQKENPDLQIGRIFYLITTRDFKSAKSLLKSFPRNRKNEDLLKLLEIDLLMSKRKYRKVLSLIGTDLSSSTKILKCIQANFCLKDHAAVFSIIAEHKDKNSDLQPVFKMCKAVIKEKYEKVLTILESLPKSQDNLEDFYFFQSFALAKLRRFDSALESLNESFELNNKSEPAWHLGFVIFYELNNLVDSFNCLNKCLQFNERAEYLVGFSRLYEKAGLPHVAKVFSAKARKVDPNFELQQVLEYPTLDFSEFGKRKTQFVPDLAVVCPVFVKPQAKKATFKKTKRSKIDDQKQNRFEPARVLGELSSSFMFKGAKGNGFKEVPS